MERIVRLTTRGKIVFGTVSIFAILLIGFVVYRVIQPDEQVSTSDAQACVTTWWFAEEDRWVETPVDCGASNANSVSVPEDEEERGKAIEAGAISGGTDEDGNQLGGGLPEGFDTQKVLEDIDLENDDADGDGFTDTITQNPGDYISEDFQEGDSLNKGETEYVAPTSPAGGDQCHNGNYAGQKHTNNADGCEYSCNAVGTITNSDGTIETVYGWFASGSCTNPSHNPYSDQPWALSPEQAASYENTSLDTSEWTDRITDGSQGDSTSKSRCNITYGSDSFEIVSCPDGGQQTNADGTYNIVEYGGDSCPTSDTVISSYSSSSSTHSTSPGKGGFRCHQVDVVGQGGVCKCSGSSEVVVTEESETTTRVVTNPAPDPSSEPVCGNGVLESGETCDLGNSNSHSCDAGPGETCDYCQIGTCKEVTKQGVAAGTCSSSCSVDSDCSSGYSCDLETNTCNTNTCMAVPKHTCDISSGSESCQYCEVDTCFIKTILEDTQELLLCGEQCSEDSQCSDGFCDAGYCKSRECLGIDFECEGDQCNSYCNRLTCDKVDAEFEVLPQSGVLDEVSKTLGTISMFLTIIALSLLFTAGSGGRGMFGVWKSITVFRD